MVIDTKQMDYGYEHDVDMILYIVDMTIYLEHRSIRNSRD